MAVTLDLDGYRHGYAEQPFAWHQEFYGQVAAAYPRQNYWDGEAVSGFLEWARPLTVVEMGGWDGALAAAVLPAHPAVGRWDNYELADVPCVCSHLAYRHHLLGDWLWTVPITGDAFVASHVLEHLSEDHLACLLGALNSEFAYVDVPLGEQPMSWMGSPTAHVLGMSIGEFDGEWERRGWTIQRRIRREGLVPSHVRWLSR